MRTPPLACRYDHIGHSQFMRGGRESLLSTASVLHRSLLVVVTILVMTMRLELFILFSVVPELISNQLHKQSPSRTESRPLSSVIRTIGLFDIWKKDTPRKTPQHLGFPMWSPIVALTKRHLNIGELTRPSFPSPATVDICLTLKIREIPCRFQIPLLYTTPPLIAYGSEMYSF